MRFKDIFKKKESENPTEGCMNAASANEAAKQKDNANNNASMEKQKQEEAGTPATENVKVYNLLIVDESGSMSAIYQEALSGVNETLQTIRMAKEDHPEQEHYVTLVTFDSGHYNQIYKGTPAEKAIDITSAQYRPGGCTPLFDAMGRAVTELRNHLDYTDQSANRQESVVLVTVITDGYENASREYTGPAIKTLVEEMRKKGWVFTYIGANQDVDKVADSMSINNRMAFQADSEGTKAMFAQERRSRGKFFSKIVNRKSMSQEDFASDFFD